MYHNQLFPFSNGKSTVQKITCKAVVISKHADLKFSCSPCFARHQWTCQHVIHNWSLHFKEALYNGPNCCHGNKRNIHSFTLIVSILDRDIHAWPTHVGKIGAKLDKNWPFWKIDLGLKNFELQRLERAWKQGQMWPTYVLVSRVQLDVSMMIGSKVMTNNVFFMFVLIFTLTFDQCQWYHWTR
jgi:hypothetical protein